jgi:SAM-dependent methyltransferase
MAFEELKQRSAVAWGAAPFEKVAETIAPMHDALVERLAPQPGERFLDVGTGTGEVAFRAARAGADVVGSDLSPVLVETAKRQAVEQGLEVRFEVGDAEQLPYEDASFDVVASSVGMIFAPDHGAAARELARVVRPGGRLGYTAWRRSGRIGEFFSLMAPFQPPPPEGAGSPLAWGDEEHARELLGDSFELDFEEHDAPFVGESGAAMWAYMVENFGPAHLLSRSLDPDRRAELDRAMIDHLEQDRDGDGIRQSRLYLLVTGTRR